MLLIDVDIVYGEDKAKISKNDTNESCWKLNSNTNEKNELIWRNE